MSKKTFNVILAISPTFGIGYKNQLPWRLSADLKNLKTITSDTKLFNSSSENKQNAVIMGRKTYESLPEKFKPLPNRLNIVLSKSGCASLKKDKSVLICDSLDNSLLQIEQELNNKIENVFVLGGAQVFDESLAHPLCEQVFLTKVGVKYECDRFISPKSLSKFSHLETSRTYIENETPFIFQRLFNPNRVLSNSIINKRLYETHGEFQYLSLIRDIINQGNERSDRTNTGTLSKFGGVMRYNLQHGFPLLTTKEVFWRGVVEELLWFIRGETNGKKLSEKNVKIWDPNGSRQFLDNLGLIHREEGDLGPVYGFQWRHFGAEYIDMHSNYEGKGVDQLMGLIERIKTDPSSRRLIMNAWNPVDLPKMALPPCHVMTQFYVQEGKLSCIMYQRSADIGLGVPFNIASYALLTCLIAQICGLERGEFIHFLGDYHVYKNHVEQLKEQIERIPGPFPILKIKNKRDKIDQFIFEDFELIGYNPQKKIKMKMAV